MLQPSSRPATGSPHPEFLIAGIVSFFVLLLSGIGLRNVLPHGSMPVPLPSTVAATLAALLSAALMLAATCRVWARQWANQLYASDPDRRQKLQALHHTASKFVFYSLIIIYGVAVYKIAFTTGSIGDLIAGWLQNSATDACITPEHLLNHASHRAWQYLYAAYPSPMLGVLTDFRPNLFANLAGITHWLVLSVALFTTWKPFTRLAALLTSCGERVAADRAGAFSDALIGALRQKASIITISDRHPFLSNCHKSMCWLIFCYCTLFGLFAFCPGDLGMAIRNWLTQSIMTAYNYGLSSEEMQQLYPFLASVIAMYAAVPFAVMSGAFLPAPRASELRVTSDWLLFPQSTLLSMKFQLLRSVDDVTGVSLKESAKGRDQSDMTISFSDSATFSFRLFQIPAVQIHQLLSVIDENASEADFDDSSLALLNDLSQLSDVKQERTNQPSGKISRTQQLFSTTFTLHQSGDRILEGKFRVIKLLASKADSATYLVRDFEHRLRILKQLYAPGSHPFISPGDKEEDVSARLLHSSLVLFDEYVHADDRHYWICDYVKGVDLNTYVQEHGPQEVDVVSSWSIELAQMLSALHESSTGVFHGALAPEKVLVDKIGNLRLLPSQRKTSTGTDVLEGNQSYNAPETLAYTCTQSSDIYSFGAILAFLLTGDHPKPFAASDLLLKQISCSHSLVTVIRRCTAVDPAERIQSFALVLEILQSEKHFAQSSQDREDTLARTTTPEQMAQVYSESPREAQSVSGLLKKLHDAGAASSLSSAQSDPVRLELVDQEKVMLKTNQEEQEFEYVLKTNKTAESRISEHE